MENKERGWLLVGVGSMLFVTKLLMLFNVMQYNPSMGYLSTTLVPANLVLSIILLVYGIYLIKKKSK